MSWTSLEEVSDGYILNKSTYDSLEIKCSFDLELAFKFIAKWFHSYFEARYSEVGNGLHRFNRMKC